MNVCFSPTLKSDVEICVAQFVSVAPSQEIRYFRMRQGLIQSPDGVPSLAQDPLKRSVPKEDTLAFGVRYRNYSLPLDRVPLESNPTFQNRTQLQVEAHDVSGDSSSFRTETERSQSSRELFSAEGYKVPDIPSVNLALPPVPHYTPETILPPTEEYNSICHTQEVKPPSPAKHASPPRRPPGSPRAPSSRSTDRAPSPDVDMVSISPETLASPRSQCSDSCLSIQYMGSLERALTRSDSESSLVSMSAVVRRLHHGPAATGPLPGPPALEDGEVSLPQRAAITRSHDPRKLDVLPASEKKHRKGSRDKHLWDRDSTSRISSTDSVGHSSFDESLERGSAESGRAKRTQPAATGNTSTWNRPRPPRHTETPVTLPVRKPSPKLASQVPGRLLPCRRSSSTSIQSNSIRAGQPLPRLVPPGREDVPVERWRRSQAVPPPPPTTPVAPADGWSARPAALAASPKPLPRRLERPAVGRTSPSRLEPEPASIPSKRSASPKRSVSPKPLGARRLPTSPKAAATARLPLSPKPPAPRPRRKAASPPRTRMTPSRP